MVDLDSAQVSSVATTGTGAHYLVPSPRQASLQAQVRDVVAVMTTGGGYIDTSAGYLNMLDIPSPLSNLARA